MLCTTLLSFVYGARLPKQITSIIHPLIICTTLTLSMTKVLSLFQLSFLSTLKSYKVGSLCPVHLGAGDLLLYMLGPAVIALACQMYDKKKLMKENIKEVGVGITVSSVGGLFGTSVLVRWFKLSNPILRLSCLSRNITSPLAMAISSILGGDVSLAVSMVVVTGLIGANFGASILSSMNINDPVAIGLSIGSAAHGLGTAAFKDEKDAFPFAAIGMALTASFCTVLVSIPVVKKLITKFALGI
jgi:putative effector of murein hydrolase